MQKKRTVVVSQNSNQQVSVGLEDLNTEGDIDRRNGELHNGKIMLTSPISSQHNSLKLAKKHITQPVYHDQYGSGFQKVQTVSLGAGSIVFKGGVEQGSLQVHGTPLNNPQLAASQLQQIPNSLVRRLDVKSESSDSQQKRNGIVGPSLSSFNTGTGGKKQIQPAHHVQHNNHMQGPRSHAQGHMVQERHQSTSTNVMKAGHSGKYLGLGNKSGLGGTHRHSLEKLKEYESHLLMSSAAINNSNTALISGAGVPGQTGREQEIHIQAQGLPSQQQPNTHLKRLSHQSGTDANSTNTSH